MGAAQRLTQFEWYDARIKPQRVVTATDAAAPTEYTPLEYVRACTRFDEAAEAGDKRPTLVYFHWPHEHPLHGETTKTLCTQALNDETAARWGMLFRCVQVDMAASDARLTALLGADGKPSLVVLDEQTQVVARLTDVATPGKMQKALKEALQKFPERWKQVQKEVAAQAKTLADAKRLAKGERTEDALGLLNLVRTSSVRVGEAFDDAVALAADLEQRLAREKAKADAKQQGR